MKVCSIKKCILFLFLLIIVAVSLSCSTYSNTKKNNSSVISDPEWIIHVPKPWYLYKKGKQKNILSYMLYKRKAIITIKQSKITPICIITNEYISTSQSLRAIALGKQTTIITSMARKGYTLKGRRDDILSDINSFITIKQSLGIAYDFTYDGNHQNYLAISIYAKRNGQLLNLNFEMTADVYPNIKEEIKTIIKSIQ